MRYFRREMTGTDQEAKYHAECRDRQMGANVGKRGGDNDKIESDNTAGKRDLRFQQGAAR